MRKQHRAAMATKARTVSFSEIAALVEMAVEGAFDPSLVAAMNQEVGYYISDDGYLQCDPSRMMLKPADGDRAAQPAEAQTTRSGRREAVQRQQDKTDAALAKKQLEINAALGVVQAAKVAPVQGSARRKLLPWWKRAHSSRGTSHTLRPLFCSDSNRASRCAADSISKPMRFSPGRALWNSMMLWWS
jgi:hypothetical protein